MNNLPIEKSEGRTKIFLSWKGNIAKLYAQAFSRLLQSLELTDEHFFFSERDISLGDEWRGQVFEKLRQSKVVVAFVTKENVGVARWIECEAAAVYLAEEGTLVFPILIDLNREGIPQSSAWKGPLSETSFCKPTFASIKKMIKRIGETCDIAVLCETKKVAVALDALITDWNELAADDESELQVSTSTKVGSILACFANETDFAEWAYQYHRIAHHARDLTVHIMDRYSPLPDPDAALMNSLNRLRDYDPHPAMVMFEPQIKDLLQVVEKVFSDLLKASGATVWVCLRDLRKDLHYHNFARSGGFPAAGRDAYSISWPKQTCHTIDRLRRTTSPPEPGEKTHFEEKSLSGQNCTIITDTTKPCWPPSMDGWFDPHRQESILGAVLLKKVTNSRKEPDQGILWWILCVNSNKPGVFTLGHQRLLQGCNDAFSVVANALVRASWNDETGSIS